MRIIEFNGGYKTMGNISMKLFLETLERTNGKMLFEGEGKEGAAIDASVKEALKRKDIKYIWAFQPDDYDLVVLEHNEDGEKPNSWSVVYLTSGDASAAEEPDIFGESMNEAENEDVVVLEQVSGNFLQTVQLCIEIASNDNMKGKAFTHKMINQLKNSVKTSKK